MQGLLQIFSWNITLRSKAKSEKVLQVKIDRLRASLVTESKVVTGRSGYAELVAVSARIVKSLLGGM